MGYVTPCDAAVTDTWQGHKNRSTPSAEPGTDYGCGYGTPIRAAEAGVVDLVHSSPTTAMGRHVGIRLDDGRYVRYLHLSETLVSVGQRVGRAQTIARSGASANGGNYNSGVHVHVSLWSAPGQAVGNTIDFERYLGASTNPSEEDDLTPEQDTRLKNIENMLIGNGSAVAIQPGGSLDRLRAIENVLIGDGSRAAAQEGSVAKAVKDLRSRLNPAAHANGQPMLIASQGDIDIVLQAIENAS
ncbi:M23 family metallopeptidase [Microbacterium sp. 16-032]|uniref:M23 family metallopeptidase n=1 Tax=Microbacterium sp. 16-032 TaxID=3239808 RepID=UPI0034E26E64